MAGVPDVTILLVPIVVLAVVAVLGFVGCTNEYDDLVVAPPQGDPPYKDSPNPPTNLGEFIFQSGPIAWWPLTDPDGASVAIDKVGTEPGGHPGNYVGTVILGPTRGDSLDDSDPFNKPTRFDGAGHIEVTHAQGDTTFETTEFSVEALVLPDAVAGGTGVPEPAPDAYVARNFSATGGWALQVVPGSFVARIWDGSGTETSIELAYSLAMPLGSAWWVLMRFLEGTLWLRVNNDIAGTGGSYAPNTTEPLQMGVGFHGALQQVAVYDRALVEQEATDHMTASKTPPP
jgi:hypothetical protein